VSTDDPVLARRARLARLATLGRRAGWGLLGIAVAAFAVGVANGFDTVVVTVVTVALAATTATLAPAIVLGYAVRAAEREDRLPPQGPGGTMRH